MPIPAKSILVAIDPKPASREAFEQGLRLAAAMKATLTAVAVAPKYEGNMHRWAITDAEEQFSHPFRTCLAEAEARADSIGRKVRTVMRSGEPGEEIVALAEEIEADLLLLGNPRRSYVERVLLGRTISKVIGLSPCEVLLIPEGAEVNFSRLLVGIDGSRCSAEAGSLALTLAARYGGEVFALTAIDVPVDQTFLYGVVSEARRKGFDALESLATLAGKQSVPIQTALMEGSPYATILAFSDTEKIDLIILGTKGQTGFPRLLMGSVVERVASLTSKPILTVPLRP